MTAPWIGHVMRAELGYVYWNKIFRVGLGKPYRNLATQRHAAVSEIQLLPLWSIDIIKHINASEMPPRGIL